MVSRRGRSSGDADRSGGLQLRRPPRSAESPPQSPPETRSRRTVSRPVESGQCGGCYDEDSVQKHVDSEEDDGKPAGAMVRKSPRLLNAAGGRRSGPRRSARPTKPTSRYQVSAMFSGTRSGLKKMDETRKRRRRGNNRGGKICSEPQRRRTQSKPSDRHNDPGGADGEDFRQEGAEGGCSANRNFEATLSRASGLNRRPSSEFLRGTFRISASGPDRTRRGAFRPSRTWLSPSDEDESDDEVQDERRPLSLWTDSLCGTRRDQLSVGAGRTDPDPVAGDRSVRFDSIGGLSGHIAALKEMVVFPLLYPEVFDLFKIQPPRGCLFYGPPGTGKTLVARALANECSSVDRKVSFFMRRGADCLSKWVGESERQLRLLFEQAYQLRPSIIFFDEIDGLAPVRSSRQDQIHSSIVSTLLALMDGLDSRSEVVVIGATNRLESIDPALRRPGRFDREFLFSLPDRESRREILKIHTSQWACPLSEDFLDELADKCVGYCGADIRAVCTEATLCALRRCYPQIYGTSQKLLLDVSAITVGSCDFTAAMRKMSPASHRLVPSPARPLSAVASPLLGATLREILQALQRLFPHAEQGTKRTREPDLTSGVDDDGLLCGGQEASSPTPPHFSRSAVRRPTSHRPRMLLAGRPGAAHNSHLAPAVLHALERFAVHSLDSAVLFGVSSTSPEEACSQVFREAKRTSPSILYIPHIQQWWETAGPALRASFCSLLNSIPSFSPILLLATCSVPHRELDPEIQSLFRVGYGEVYTVSAPTRQERTDFFQDLILHQAAEAPPSATPTSIQMVLPPAAPPPAPPPRQRSEQELLHLQEQEEDVLRELRLCLRNVAERLALDRRFKAFSRPVDSEEVPDYLMLVKRPVDFSTLLANIDKHKYVTVSEFVSDTDLIWQNALKFNPTDCDIPQRAHALKDAVRAIISEELDVDLERICEEIKDVRSNRASDLKLQHTHSWRAEANPDQAGGVRSPAFSGNSPAPACKKKRSKQPRKSRWSAGVIKRTKKKKKPLVAARSSSLSNSEPSSAAPSSSTVSGGSDRDQSPPTATASGCQPDHRTANGAWRSRTEKRNRGEARASGAASEQLVNGGAPVDGEMPPLLVDRSQLRALLSRAVAETEGAEVESLEKLYALLAQCIYRHRNNGNKSELLQEMKTEIDSFS